MCTARSVLSESLDAVDGVEESIDVIALTFDTGRKETAGMPTARSCSVCMSAMRKSRSLARGVK